MNEPKVISSKTIFKKKYFSIEEQEIVLRDNKKVTYHAAVRQPIVAVLPVTNKDQIYLVSQFRILLGKKMLEVVAGHVEEGERPLQAAKRELKEETGIDAFQWEQLRRIEISASIFRTQIYFFLAKDIELAIAEPDEDEEIQLVKLPLHEAVKKVMMGEINTSTSIIGIMLLDAMKRNKQL